MDYKYKKETHLSFNNAVEKTRQELKKQGFGVLTEIDVKATMKKKLNVDYEDYIILGACNPPFAHKVLQEEKDIGLMLPCNVIVYKEKGKVFVSAINPLVAMSVVDNKNLEPTAQKINSKLKEVVERI